ncbi:MAG: hypothetical protein U9N59_01575 [Campylobacterota bacterium]|nr:hypothetical protein [Campylobacterota bacterium]
MSYSEIFILGWNLNGLMFVINLFTAMNVMKSTDIVTMSKDQETLSELKEELDTYYPNRSWETLISYFIPFTAFFRVSWRFYEMKMFFTKNEGTRLFDFMVYRYQKDIQIAKNR